MSVASRWWRLRHNRFPPTVIDGRPAANASWAQTSRPRSTARRRVLANRSAALRYPRRRRRDRRRRFCSASSTRCELAGPQHAALLQHLNRGTQIRDLGGQAAHPQLVLILHRAGDRPGPPRRRHRRQRLLTLRPPHRVRLADPTDPTPPARPAHRDTPTPTAPRSRSAPRPQRPWDGSGSGSAPPPARPPPPDHRSDAAPAPSHAPHPGSRHRQQDDGHATPLTTAQYQSLPLTIQPAVANPVALPVRACRFPDECGVESGVGPRIAAAATVAGWASR